MTFFGTTPLKKGDLLFLLLLPVIVAAIVGPPILIYYLLPATIDKGDRTGYAIAICFALIILLSFPVRFIYNKVKKKKTNDKEKT